MNNLKPLYVIVGILILSNVATLAYLIGENRSNIRMGFGMMGRQQGMDSEYWRAHEQIDTTDEMLTHMEKVHGKKDYNTPIAEIHSSTHDFGVISKETGVINTTFEIENHGKEPLEIIEISTSCSCTTAEIDKKTIGYNEVGNLIVYFDPNFHEEPQGKLTRSVFVKTNDRDLPEIQFDIYVEILD